MPEGPEVKRLAQRLGKVLVGKPLLSVAFSYRTLTPSIRVILI